MLCATYFPMGKNAMFLLPHRHSSTQKLQREGTSIAKVNSVDNSLNHLKRVTAFWLQQKAFQLHPFIILA